MSLFKTHCLSICLLAALVCPLTKISAAPAQKKLAGVGSYADRSTQLNEQGVARVKAKDFLGAEDLFKRALELDPKNLTAVFNLAGMYVTNRDEPAAIELLNTYIERSPKDAGLHARLGDAYFASKQIDKAIVAYEKCLKLSPNYVGIAGKLGTLYSLHNRFIDAERMFQIASKQDPKNAQLFANLSSLYLANGKPEQAISSAKSALQIKPTSEVYVTLGNAYHQINDSKNAVIAYQRAMDLGNKDPELKKYIDGQPR